VESLGQPHSKGPFSTIPKTCLRLRGPRESIKEVLTKAVDEPSKGGGGERGADVGSSVRSTEY
jgi:hypothetical protein